MLMAGADKVSINTAAVMNPNLIKQGAEAFGSQCIVLGMDAQRINNDRDNPKWEIRTHTGSEGGKASGLDAIEWAVMATNLGAGEIVVNSIDADGTKSGYDLELSVFHFGTYTIKEVKDYLSQNGIIVRPSDI